MEERKYVTMDKIVQLISWGRHKEAIKEAEELLREEPEDADLLALLSVAYRSVDDDKALYFSSEALRRDPEHEDAWRSRLFTYYDQEDWKKFSSTLDEVLRIFPHKSYPYFMLGQYQLKTGKFTDAIANLEQAIEIYPEAIYYAVYSYALALVGKDRVSAEAEQTALRMDPEDSSVLMNAAWSADKRGEYDKAIQYMGSAIRLDPDNEQVRKEYLEVLQKRYWFYRVLLWPNVFRKFKAWQILVLWFVCWIIFRPLVVLFIILYIASYWVSKALVHIKVFGWTWPSRR
jgi:tetratricopeptide (TPR) repeat protein